VGVEATARARNATRGDWCSVAPLSSSSAADQPSSFCVTTMNPTPSVAAATARSSAASSRSRHAPFCVRRPMRASARSFQTTSAAFAVEAVPASDCSFAAITLFRNGAATPGVAGTSMTRGVPPSSNASWYALPFHASDIADACEATANGVSIVPFSRTNAASTSPPRDQSARKSRPSLASATRSAASATRVSEITSAVVPDRS
jgi:hypothetical protein